jgi:hypothetical protein
MSDTSINIEDEQAKITNKINSIKNSGVFHLIKSQLNKLKDNTFDRFQDKNINIYGRIKKATSASEKIAKKNIPASEIYDLLAFMIVVDLPDNYELIKNSLQENLSNITYSHNFDGNLPENNGYSSLHLGINVDDFLPKGCPSGLENLSAEIQLKTYGMYMAQEATHDSIYKNNNLSNKQKYDMQSLMFPMIEHLTDIEMYERALNATVDQNKREEISSKITSLKKQIENHKEKNLDYINENMPLVESVFKEYIARKQIENIKQIAEFDLSTEHIEQLIESFRNAIDYLNDSQDEEKITDTQPTGFKNIDELLVRFDKMTFEEMENLSQKYRKRNSKFFSVSAVAASKKSVTIHDLSDTLNDLQEHIDSEKESDEVEK